VPRLDLVHADQARPVAADLVDRLEQQRDVDLVLGAGQDALQRRDRLAMLGLDLEDLRVGVDRAAQLPEVLLAQRAQAPEQQHRLGGSAATRFSWRCRLSASSRNSPRVM
jgi:hypothetical protein